MKNRNGQESRMVPSVAVYGVLVLLDIYLLLRYYDWQAGVFTLEMLTELSLVTVFGSGLVQSMKKWMERNPRPQREEKRKHLKHWMYILLLLVSVFMLGFALYLLPQYLQGGYSLYSMDMLLLLACFLLWGIYLVISIRALAKGKANS